MARKLEVNPNPGRMLSYEEVIGKGTVGKMPTWREQYESVSSEVQRLIGDYKFYPPSILVRRVGSLKLALGRGEFSVSVFPNFQSLRRTLTKAHSAVFCVIEGDRRLLLIKKN